MPMCVPRISLVDVVAVVVAGRSTCWLPRYCRLSTIEGLRPLLDAVHPSTRMSWTERTVPLWLAVVLHLLI
jgi:hypothetical protein